MNKCVYVHLIDNIPIYVGSGSYARPYQKSRGSEHDRLFLHENFRIVIVEKGLTTTEALQLEFEIISVCEKLGFKLLNKAKVPCHVVKIIKQDIDKYLYYDESSPTKLRWSCDIYRGGRWGSRLIYRAHAHAGSIRKNNGYSTVQIDGKPCLIHRVVWVLHNGEILDDNVIDHIDGNPNNNTISNLRCVSQSSNCKVKKHRKSNTGFQSISESIRPNTDGSSLFIVSWTEELYKRKSKVFSYGPWCRTRDEAFKLALDFRNDLITKGIIEKREGIK